MKETKILALFGYPMDNSVRAKVFDSQAQVVQEAAVWKDISYFICSFEVTGEIYTEI